MTKRLAEELFMLLAVLTMILYVVIGYWEWLLASTLWFGCFVIVALNND